MSIWTSFRRFSMFRENKRNRFFKKTCGRDVAAPKHRNLRLEQFEERALLAIGPELVGIIPTAGGLLAEDQVLDVAPRELTIRFNEGQTIDSATLGGIRTVRAGTDGLWNTPDDVPVQHGWIGIGDKPNEVIVRYAQTLPDDLYHIDLIGSDPLGTGSPILRNTAGAPFGDGTNKSFPFELDLGAQVIAVVPQPMVYDTITVTAVDPALIGEGDTFTVTDGTDSVTFEFEDVLGDGNFDPNNVVIDYVSFDDTDVKIAERMFTAISGLVAPAGPLDVTINYTPGSNQIEIVGASAGFDEGGMPLVVQTLHQKRDTIEVYFNDDELDLALATNVRFYQLFDTNDTLQTNDDVILLPSNVRYDGMENKAVLEFSSDLPDGTYRLQLGTSDESNETLGTSINVGTLFDTTDFSQAAFVGDEDGSNDVDLYRIEIAAAGANLSVDVAPGAGLDAAIRLFNAAGAPVTMIDAAGAGAAESLSMPLPVGTFYVGISSSGNTAYAPTDGSGNANGNSSGSYQIDLSVSNPIGAGDDNSSFDTATQLGVLGTAEQRFRRQIEPQTAIALPQYPGGSDEPGHRSIPAESHGAGVGTSTSPPGPIGVLQYNFASVYGVDTQGNTLYNQINEDQKDRAREIFEMYASLFGFEVRETASSGLRVVTGDIRALAPTYPPAAIGGISGGGMVIMNAMQYGNPAQDVFGGGWMGVALHEIGHSIGLGHSYDVRSTMGGGTQGEDAYPGQADVIHAQRIHRPDAVDIDMYQLAVTERGLFTAETVAERMAAPDDSSLLNTALRLYRQEVDGSRTLIAQNDDYYSNDSYIELALEPGTYFIGVSSTGNTDYDPTISDSGFGGLTDGVYDLKFKLSPAPNSSLQDATLARTVFDGDNDGAPGGAHEFFFRSGNTIFVDKSVITNLKQSLAASSGSQTIQVVDARALDVTPGVSAIKVDGEEMLVTAVNPVANTLTVTRGYNATPITAHAVNTPVRLAGEDGSLMMPYGLISSALAAASPGDVIRIIGNGGADDNVLTVGDNRPYLVGLNTLGLPLEDGSQFQIPRDVVVQVDAGAILKLKGAVVDAGTSDQLFNRSGGALQVLGTPGNHVRFTSFADDSIGGDSNGAGPPALSGDWGGLVFRPDSDFQDPSADADDPGIFLNYVNQAEIAYGGGSVEVDSIESVYTPIHVDTTRPTITNNKITRSANAAISANPDAFDDSRGRIGPMIRGNTVTNNTINGVFVRIATAFGEPLDRLTATARFDDTDIVHVVTENLEMVGNVGGPIDNNEIQQLAITGTPSGGNFRLAFIAGASTSLRADVDASTNTLLVNSTRNFPPTPFDIQVGSEMMTVTGATATTFTVSRGALGTAAQAHNAGTSIREAHSTGLLPFDATIFDIRAALFGLRNVGVDNVRVTGGPLPSEPVEIEFVKALAAGNQPTLFVQDILTGATPVISTVQNGGQWIVARPSGRLKVDPDVVVKLSSSRIEALRGNSHLIAEGTDESPVIFTSLHDDRYGAGGTFDTSNNGASPGPAKGDWGGLIFDANSRGSIDQALIAYGGGGAPIAGGFANFSTIEVHNNAHVRLANSTLTGNDDLATGNNRDNRGGNDASLIFVRQAQPIIVNNVFEGNDGNVISINANALVHTFQRDTGRSTGLIDAFDQFSDNHGPLVRLNRMTNNGTSGMNVRAETLTNESVWDDTDIVHVLRGEIVVDQHMTYSGLRLQSAVDESLVVKLSGANAGFTADGIPLDIDDRIGGTVQIVGQPGSPVILTSLADDSVGASFEPNGFPHTDTNNDGPSTGSPGDWRSLLFEKYSNDRNVRIVLEPELANNNGIDLNNSPFLASFLGELAPNQKSGDENRVLGFEVQGHISGDDPGDVDVYSFKATTGTEVWIDVDRTRGALDTVVELIQSNGTVLARSIVGDVFPGDPNAVRSGAANPLAKNAYDGGDYYTMNQHDAGFRVVLPGPAGQTGTFYVRVRSNSPNLNQPDGGLTSGEYQLQIRLQQRDEKPGSTVRYADIRFPQVGIDVRGLPAHSPLLAESDETTGDNQGIGGSQNLGNLLESDRNTISFSGELTNSADLDFYKFNVDYAFTELGSSIQAIGGVNAGGKTWATVFDLDYSDGLTRGDTTMIVFRADGTPILIGRESNITDDQPAPGQGTDLDDFTRGTVGKLDPFIGTVQLPAGTPSSSGGTEYYVAVSANGRLLTDLNQFYQAAAANTNIRLEPINSVDRIIEDHIGFQGYSTNGPPVDPIYTTGLFGSISNAQSLSTTVRAFDLSDVLLYVNTTDTLRAVNPLFGQQMYTIDNDLTATNEQMQDIVMRSDGQLYGYQRLNNTVDTAGRLVTINHATGALGVVGTDNIDGETPAPAVGGNNPGDVDFDDLTVTDDVGAVTFERSINSSNNPIYWGWYSVFENGFDVSGNPSINSKLYRFNADTGAIENDVANNRDSGFGDIQYFDVQYASANITVSDGTAPASNIRVQARAPGLAGNGITINIVRGDFTTAVDAVAIGPGVIELRIDDTPSPSSQAITDRLNSDNDSRFLITAANTNTTNDTATTVAPAVVVLGGGSDGALGPIRGNVTGLAFATAEPNDSADLYAVTSRGELVRISASQLNGTDTRMDAVLVRDFEADLGITGFAGLSIGPQNLHGGLFSSTLFAITSGGQLIAFDTSGTEVFAFGSDNEQQTLQLLGFVNPADSFTLTFTSDRFAQSTTGPIPATATAAQVRNALTVLSTLEGVPIVAPGDVIVSGTLASGLTIEFTGFFQDKNVAQLSVNNSGMTSGLVVASTAAQGGDGVRDQFTVSTGIGGVSGLAFSPVDVNLWHPTVRRGNDEGHGINAPFDLSRTPGDEDRTHSDGSGGSNNDVYDHTEGQGGVSFYFGLEEYVDNNDSEYLNYEANRTQLGIRDNDFHRDLTFTGIIGSNYDLPGGAFGSLITRPFDLTSNTGSSDADDRPTLYFNYWLNTEGANANPSQPGEMKDSARVYLSSDGGRTWNLLATNNSPRSYTENTELPSFASHTRFADAPDSRQRIQELYETSNWRQARVDLSDFVGRTDLVLRFDFSTAGTIVDPNLTTRHTDLDTPQDGFGDHQGDGATGDFQRAQNNAQEGFYIDDIIIGWAERGEMITAANAGATGYFQAPTDPDPDRPQVIENGPYQVEIRRGLEYAGNASADAPEIQIAFTMDTNDRLIPDGITSPPATDDFDTVPLNLGWTTTADPGSGQWIWESNIGVGNSGALRSAPNATGPVGHNEASLLWVAVATGSGNVTFDYRAIVGPGDAFQVFVDEIGEHPADFEHTNESDTGWHTVSIPVTAGAHTFFFRYAKDGGDPDGAPANEGAILDNVVFPGRGGMIVGDRNLERVQGAFQIENNFVREVADMGIRVDAGSREGTGGIENNGPSSNNPTPGSPINFDTQNTQRFAPGVVIQNNVVAGFGSTGIYFAGEANTAGGVPAAAVPVGKIVNNTVYGGETPSGTAIQIANGGAAIVLNNIVANANLGISTVGASGQSVYGRNFFHGNNANGTTGANAIIDPVANPLFVDTSVGNFYLADGAEAIDRSLGSLPDIPSFVSVKTPLGIPNSDAFSPTKDLFGQPRVDDPGQPPSGLGNEVFHDLGATERADNSQPFATVLVPLDQGLVDADPDLNEVLVLDAAMTEFVIQLSDVGVGIDDLSVLGTGVHLWQDLDPSSFDYATFQATGTPATLIEDTDYLFRYDAVRNRISLIPTIGFWPKGSTFTILLDDTIRDLAGNSFLPTGLPAPFVGLTVFHVTLADWDYGDAPDAPLNNYPSRNENQGARHMTNVPLYLGSGVTSENDSLENADASGDLFDDGVSFDSALWMDHDSYLTVNASGGGYLNAWIDFNADGDWLDANEQIATDLWITQGDNSLIIPIPDATAVGLLPGEFEKISFARFRFSSETGLGVTGYATDGEVEDYQVTLVKYATDFGDAPEPLYPTTLAQNGGRHLITENNLFLGGAPDGELDGQPDPNALGDDNDLISDDEDGITFTSMIIPGDFASMQIDLSGAAIGGVLNAWIDFDGDGDWSDPGEQIIDGVFLTNTTWQAYVSVPAGAIPGPTFARFRINSDGLAADGSDLSFDGLALDGEVEDYQVFIEALDFGDALDPTYPTLLASNGARHVLDSPWHVNPGPWVAVPGPWLGDTVDPDADGQPDLAALGDDNPFGTEENGIIFTTALVPGDPAGLDVDMTASPAGGWLNAWIDFDASGDWTGPDEQIITDLWLDAGGIYSEVYTIPGAAVGGDTFARFRISSQPGLGWTGVAFDGEVEDYSVRIDYRPIADPGGPYSAIDEGSTITLDGSGSFDPDGTIVLYEWDFEDDGTYDFSSTTSAFADFTPPDDGLYTIRLRVTDNDGATGEGTVQLTVLNVAPTILVTGNSNVNEGSVYTVILGTITDPGDDTVTLWTVHWGDGVSQDFTSGGAKTHTYADGPNNYTIQVDLTDEDGTFTNAGSKNVTVDNVAPTILVTGNNNVNEGSVYTVNLGAITDPGVDTVTQWIVHWGDGQTDSYASDGDKTHTYADGPNLYTIRVDLTDEDGTHADAGSKNVTVDNVAPTIVLSGNSNVNEGSTYTLTLGAITDPGVDTVTQWIVHWGDGQTNTFTSTGAKTHVFADGPNLYTIRVDLADEDGTHANAGALNVTVDNVAPTILLSGNSNVNEGSSYALTLDTITDPGVDTVTSWVVHWGDGQTNTFTSAGVKTHVYADGPNLYTISVDLTDEDGAYTNAGSKNVTVDNVAPTILLGGSSNVNEGSPYVLTLGAVTDPGVDTVTQWVVHWGDGQTDTFASGGAKTHTYADGPNLYTIWVDLTDEDGSYANAGGKNVTVDNVAPTIQLTGNSNVDEASPYTLTLDTITDPGVDTVTQWIVHWGDGQTDNFTSDGDKTHVYADGPNLYTIRVDLTDEDGTHLNAGSKDVTVNNVAPSVAADHDPVTVNEGQQAANTGTFFDVGNDVVTITTSLGLVTQVGTQSGTWNWWFNTHDGPDESQDVIIRATDSDGAVTTTTFRLDVRNVAPVVAANTALVTVNESQTAANAGTFSDVGLDSVTITASVGTVTRIGTRNGTWAWSFHATNGPADSQTVMITATDSDGDATTTTFDLVVNNLAPTVAANQALVNANEGSTATNTGTFADLGNDVVTVTASIGTIAQTGTKSGTWTWSFGTADGPDQSQIVQITADDGDGGVATTTFHLTVNNLAPTVAADHPATVVDEGQTATNTGTFADLGDDVVTVTASIGTVTQVGTQTGTWNWSFLTSDGDDEDQTVTVTATDSDGALRTTTFRLFVGNVAPSVNAGPDQTADEAQPVSFSGAFTDPGSGDTHTITWSFGDGASASGTLTPTHTFADDGVYTVMLTVEDDDGGITTDTLTVTVNNIDPTVEAGLDRATVEGQTIAFAGAFTDPGADTWTATVDFGDGSGVQPLTVNPGKTVNFSHAYTDNGVYTVTLTVRDDDMGEGSDTLQVTVANVSPTIALSGNDNVSEGSPYTLTLGAITDPGNDTVTEWTVHWGDGQADTFTSGGNQTHVYADGPNPYTISVDLKDEDGTYAGAGSKAVTVKNVAPVVTLVQLGRAVVERGVPVTVTGSFTDAGSLDTHTATVNWGDTTTSPAVVDPINRTFTATHVYSEALDFAVGVTVLDKDGAGHGGGALLTVAEPLGPASKVGVLETLNPQARDLWYTVDVMRNTDFTIEAIVTDPPRTAALTLYDTNLNQLAVSTDVLGIQTIVYPAAAGAKFFFKLSGTSTDVDLRVTVENIAPDVTADNALVTVDEGQTAVNTGTFSDLNLDDVVVLTASFGTVTQTGTQDGTWTWSFDTSDGPDQNTTVTIRATDSEGAWTETTFGLAVDNAAPALAADNSSVTVDEGQTAANSGTFADPGTDVVTITTTFGTVTQVGTQSGTWSWSLGTADGPSQSQTVTITATDSDGAVTTANFDLSVENVAPVVAADNSSVNVDEGQTAANTGTFADPGFDVVTISASVGSVTQVGTQVGTWAWSLDTTDGPDDTQTVTITATDSDGEWTQTTFDLTVDNLAPSVAAASPSVNVEAGQTAANTGTFSDLGVDVVTVTASIGTVTQLGTQSGNWAWWFDTTDGFDESQTVTITATDSDGDWTQTSFALVVNLGAPVVAADHPSVAADEGQTATNTGTFSDPDLDDVTITASLGTVAQTGTDSGTWSWSFDTSDGPDESQTVTVRATDQGGRWTETTFELAVGNLAPGVAADKPVVAVDGARVASNTGTFYDVGVDNVTITASIGTLNQTGAQSGVWTWSLDTTGNLDESQTVTITATDEDGDSSETTFIVAQQIQHDGTTITVDGTDGDDLFEFDASAYPSIRIALNGLLYSYDASEATDVIFDGGPGDDAVILTGSDATDLAYFYPDHGTFQAAGLYLVTFSDVSSTTAYGAGDDIAYMYDSPGADTFTVSPFAAEFTGPGFAYETQGFMQNYGYATTDDGEVDTAIMNDSAGNDKFKLDRPQPDQFFGKMYRGDYFNRAKMFEVIEATSSSGDDLARFFDSPGDDTFEAEDGFGRMVGPDFVVTAYNYSQMIAFSDTGNDTANLTDSVVDDTVRARGHKTEMYDTATKGDGYKIVVRGFGDVHLAATTPNGGYDVAKLHDTALDDLFEASPGEASLSKRLPGGSLDLLYHAVAFEQVRAYSLLGGSDTAILNDTPGDDHLEADYRFVADLNQDDTWAGLYTYEGIDLRLLYDVIAFDSVEARSSTGRNTTDVAAGVDFLLLDNGWEK